MPTSHLTVIGDVFVDVTIQTPDLTPPPGSDTLIPPILTAPGGSGLNFLTHFLNSPTSISHVDFHTSFNETDNHGKVLETHLSKYATLNVINDSNSGFKSEFLLSIESLSTGHCVVLTSSSTSERTFFTHRGLISNLNPSPISPSSSSSHLHLTGLMNMSTVLHSLRSPESSILKTFKSYYSTSSTSLVPQYSPNPEDYELINVLLPYTTFLICSENEAISIGGLEYVSFFSKTCDYTVITKGKNGAEVIKKDKGIILKATSGSIPSIIDSTGAGDAFSAGFLLKILENDDIDLGLKEGLINGCGYGSSCCMNLGATEGLRLESVRESVTVEEVGEVVEINKTKKTIHVVFDFDQTLTCCETSEYHFSSDNLDTCIKQVRIRNYATMSISSSLF